MNYSSVGHTVRKEQAGLLANALYGKSIIMVHCPEHDYVVVPLFSAADASLSARDAFAASTATLGHSVGTLDRIRSFQNAGIQWAASATHVACKRRHDVKSNCMTGLPHRRQLWRSRIVSQVRSPIAQVLVEEPSAWALVDHCHSANRTQTPMVCWATPYHSGKALEAQDGRCFEKVQRDCLASAERPQLERMPELVRLASRNPAPLQLVQTVAFRVHWDL